MAMTSASGNPLKVFVEKNIIPPMRVAGVARMIAKTRPVTPLIQSENGGKPFGEIGGDFPQMHEPSGPVGAFERETVTVKVVVPFEGLNEEIVDGKPDGTTPIGIPAEQGAAGLSRLVLQAVLDIPQTESIRGPVSKGEGSDAPRGKKLIRISHVTQDTGQPLPGGDR
jgi:hypothetical protein